MVRLLLLLCLLHHLPAVIGEDYTVSPGDTVTLPCGGGTSKDSNRVEVSWEFGGMTVCLFKNGTLCEHRDFVNRTQLGSIQQNNFSLVINPVRVQDQGEYKCLINGGEIQINRLFVKGGRKQRAAEIPPEDGLICDQYVDKDKEVPDKNPPGAPSSVWLTVTLPVTVVILMIPWIVVLFVQFIRRRRKQLRNLIQNDSTDKDVSHNNETALNSPHINLDNLAPPAPAPRSETIVK